MKKIVVLMGLCCFLFPRLIFAQEVTTATEVQSLETSDSLSTKDAVQQEEISIVGFKRLVNDLTARVVAPKYDQNGELCALIKVVTKDKALFFEPDALGITARDDQPGEIWLYVPHGAKRITIKHERFGIIRNYFYNEPIDKAVAYELQLYVPTVKQERIVVRQEVTAQSLMMNYSPATANIYIDDVLQQTNGNGAFTVVLPLGQHNYRVEAKHHKEENGVFEIVPERPTALNVALQAQYGFIKATSNKADAEITVNDAPMGVVPYNSDTLKIGTYRVKAERKWYVPQEREVEVKPTERSEVEFNLKRQKPNIFLLAQLGMAVSNNNQNSFGLMAGICRKGGAYYSIRTNGSPSGVNDDISNALGAYTGKSKKHHLSTSAGFMVRIFKPLYLYGGFGYLRRTIDWETSGGEYQTVVDNSGLIGEVGLIGRYKNYSISIGYVEGSENGISNGLRGNEDYHELTIGIGYVFGR